ncbi:MAG: OB-fold domain-containing protein, partial [Deltaproteobacteria bacterium]|nr:OB-fold domain-containing protein [Deltaproteobacteria bacterium]
MAFTGDHLAFSWDPPQIYGLVDFEEGGRILLDLTDCSLDTVSVGMPVRMSFRRKYADPNRGYFGYFWKAVPATS